MSNIGSFFSSKQGLLKVRGWGRIEVCAICIDRKGAIHKKDNCLPIFEVLIAVSLLDKIYNVLRNQCNTGSSHILLRNVLLIRIFSVFLQCKRKIPQCQSKL